MSSSKVCLYLSFLSMAASAEQSSSDLVENILEGRALQMQGRFQEAKLRFESALREAERAPEKADTLTMALSNLASVQIDLGRMDEAARLCERAISILIKTAEEADSRVQRLRTELAALYLASGQDSTAEKLLRQTVALQARTSQTATPEGAYTLDVLACFYARRNKLALAEKTERQALSVLEAISGSGSLSIGESSLHLSVFLNSRKRAVDALPYAERAMATFKALPEPQPFLESGARMSLASIYAGLGRGDEARTESEGAVRQFEAFFGPDHPETGWALLAHAAVLRHLNWRREARAAQEMGNRIVEANRKQNHLGDTVPLETLLPVR